MSQSKLHIASQSLKTQSFDYQQLNEMMREEIQELTIDIKNKLRRCAQDILEIGDNLGKIKEKLGHGQFRSWLKTEFDWSVSTANKFMHVSQRFKVEELKEVEIAPSALYVLAAPSTPEKVRHQALFEAKQGKNITYSLAKKLVKNYQLHREYSRSLEENNMLIDTPSQDAFQNSVIVEATQLSPIQAQDNNSNYLTPMYNLSDFNYYLEQEWRRMMREKKDLSLFLSQFSLREACQLTSSIAEVIQEIAQGLAEGLKRPGDFAGKYGHNQWAAVLPNTDQEGSRYVCQRFLNWFSTWEKNLILSDNDLTFPIYLNIGTATISPGHNNSYHELINKAKQGLLEAQSQGYNSIVSK
jgi:diguanylate cyclase (GGDEF)-like protein